MNTQDSKELQELKEKMVVALTLAKEAWLKAGMGPPLQANNYYDTAKPAIGMIATEIFKKL